MVSADYLIPSTLLSDQAYYAAHFMDLAMWEPSVRKLCIQHGFSPKRVSPGLPGSFPTFIVELEFSEVNSTSRLIVVKFFGPLFDGYHSFAIERAMGRYLTPQSLPVPSPGILAEGDLAHEWSYLIFEGIPGVSLGQVRQQISQKAWMLVAEQMGKFIHALHASTANTLSVMAKPISASSWATYVDFLQLQRANCPTNHLRWNDLPSQLAGQVQDYLLPVDQLVDLASSPHLIHADLTADHLLGRTVTLPKLHARTRTSANWESLAIIDWGDARVGNILYELVALYLDLLHADRHLLHICLESYKLSDFYQQDFPHKALCMVLLHQFPMPASIYTPYHDAHTLSEVAQGLFGG